MLEKNKNYLYRYIVAVGSNIQPKENIKKTLEILEKEQYLVATSNFIQTKPIGYQNQADFFNGAIYIKTNLKHDDFRSYLKEVEKRLKRVKGKIKSGPRTIDLDIIIQNEQVIDNDFYKAKYIQKPAKELLSSQNIILK